MTSVFRSWPTPTNGVVQMIVVSEGSNEESWGYRHLDQRGEPVAEEQDFDSREHAYASLAEYLVTYIATSIDKRYPTQ